MTSVSVAVSGGWSRSIIVVPMGKFIQSAILLEPNACLLHRTGPRHQRHRLNTAADGPRRTQSVVPRPAVFSDHPAVRTPCRDLVHLPNAQRRQATAWRAPEHLVLRRLGLAEESHREATRRLAQAGVAVPVRREPVGVQGAPPRPPLRTVQRETRPVPDRPEPQPSQQRHAPRARMTTTSGRMRRREAARDRRAWHAPDRARRARNAPAPAAATCRDRLRPPVVPGLSKARRERLGIARPIARGLPAKPAVSHWWRRRREVDET